MKTQEDYYQEIVEQVIAKGNLAYFNFLKDSALKKPKNDKEHRARIEFIENWHDEYAERIFNGGN